ncbi:MAG: tRNA preQ1(34) S-adenosylmethionine ribosyltransferase-isomerase QueA [Candidatus Omnitrophica bacterium]|nr:tRNA preQ1(34) S-adenosylmethionine ribosyltransferase-isomerase QueA [Candidatus Omnitrophota bacterium]
MDLSEYDYNLPEELIAQAPVTRRDSCRLMAINRDTRQISHKRFYEIKEFIRQGDCLVLNDTRVIPARLFGKIPGCDKKIEVFLLRQVGDMIFEALTKPGRKVKEKDEILFGNGEASAEIMENSRMVKKIKLRLTGTLPDFLNKSGVLPLPPYIKREPSPEDYESYQTVYARRDGAVAAPTAGLHFTKELLDDLSKAGISTAFLTLHVGYGTFQPLRAEDSKPALHSEYYEIGAECARTINRAKETGGRVWAVGTTACRALETAVNSGKGGEIEPQDGWTDIFIQPPYRFGITGGLITNFHLPKTTLLLLASAFCGKDLLKQAYSEAIEKQYKFYSYGDAMIVY